MHQTRLKHRFRQDTRSRLSARAHNGGQHSLIHAGFKVLFLVPDKRIPCTISAPYQASGSKYLTGYTDDKVTPAHLPKLRYHL